MILNVFSQLTKLIYTSTAGRKRGRTHARILVHAWFSPRLCQVHTLEVGGANPTGKSFRFVRRAIH